MTQLAQLIEALLLKGCPRHLVDEAIEAERKGEAKPSKEEINAAYAEVLDAWVRNETEDADKVQAYHIRTRKFLYQKSLTINDFKTAFSILQDLAKLQNSYGHKIKPAKPTKETDEESEVKQTLRLIHDKTHNKRPGRAAGKR